MSLRTLIDPRMVTSLDTAGLFPASCTIQENAPTRTTSGALRPNWDDVSGLVDIPCSVQRLDASKQRQPELVTTETTHLIALAGPYPSIEPSQRALIDGTAYEILGVRTDVHSVMTWLAARIRTVTG